MPVAKFLAMDSGVKNRGGASCEARSEIRWV